MPNPWEEIGLVEQCRHPSASNRCHAVRSIDYEKYRWDDRVAPQLMEMLADEHPAVVQEVVYKLNAFGWPESDKASPELIARVLARSASDPEDLLFCDALNFFRDEPRVMDYFVGQVAKGSPLASDYLRSSDLRRLTPKQISRLCRGRLEEPLVQLLEKLGERALEAAPRLRKLPTPSALMALLSMPSEIEYVQPRLPEVYVNEPTLRTRILMHHPNLPALAREVIPQLSADARSGRFQEIEDLYGLRLLGPLAVSEVSWLIDIAQPETPYQWRNAAVDLLGHFGEAARPAFPNFRKLLKDPMSRQTVHYALNRLGPIAAEFEVR